MTKQIKLGRIKIGGGAPIVIQSMTKTDTRDVDATISQIKELEKVGCQLVRVAVKDFEACSAIKKIKKHIKIPVAADIHFDYRLAIKAIEKGADKIRLNPGNIHKEEQILEIARLAKKKHVPIRVGVNSGSLRKVSSGEPSPHRGEGRVRGNKLAGLMVRSALDYIKTLEKAGFYDIIVSLKSSEVITTIDAYRRFSKRSNYPLHLGITAAGPLSTGLVKSSIGIGALLLEGIGDTIRVSLTAHPCEEVIAAKNILQTLRLRRFSPEIISCPACGRSQVDLQKIVQEIESRIIPRLGSTALTTSRSGQANHEPRTTKIAIMGCEVNGPGEAKDADIGIAFGKAKGALFKKGKIIKRVKYKEAIEEILKNL